MSERREALPRPGQVEPQRLGALATLVGGQLIGADVPVSGVTASSGRVRAGDLFAGLPGRGAHGARFATAASAGGAVAVLTDRDGLLLVPPGVPVVVVDSVRARLGAVSAEIYGRPSRAPPRWRWRCRVTHWRWDELTASTSRWSRSPTCRRTTSTSTATWTTTSPRRRGCSTDGRARRSWSSTTSGDAGSRRSSAPAS